MDFFVEYWYIIVAVVAILAAAAFAVYCFVKKPTSEQIIMVREWLLWAVTEAEKALGGGTGKLKLRHVYDLFVVRFPWLAKVISFDHFSQMVDEALVEMRRMLDTNDAVASYVIENK